MRPILIIFLTAVLFSGCNTGGDSSVESKKKQLETAQKELATLKERIAALEKEISEADPAFARQQSKAILVSTFKAEHKPFEHRVEVRGAVESRRNVSISAQTGGEIHRIHVREGQQVAKGQVLITLDADIIRSSIAELKTSLELARSVYEKQSKLWEQKIGTELQYLQAKNNMESLERRLATANAQLAQTIIRAPFAGTVDQLPAREGELATPGVPLVRVVSLDDAFIKADVSERFIGKFKAGDKVQVFFPATGERIASTISSVSQIINPENRTFIIEVNMPAVKFMIKPNQVVVLEMSDYINENALAVPTRLIQRDETGQFVYIIDNRGNNPLARKAYVSLGITAGNLTEIIDGLSGDELIVDQGYRELSDGVEVIIAETEAAAKNIAKN